MLIGPNRSIVGVSLYPAHSLLKALQFLQRGRHGYPLHNIAAEVFPLDEINAAFTAAAAGSAGQGSYKRIAIRP